MLYRAPSVVEMERSGPVVELRGVRKLFGATAAVAGIDLELVAGEVHAWVGENGAGKSTLARVLAGLHGDYAGEIRVGGEAVRLATPAAAAACGIALVHQEPSLVAGLPVAENIYLGRAPRGRWPWLVDFAAMRENARALLAELGVSIPVRARVADLTPGERQLVEVAKGLARESRVLILDEPTSSLSARETRELLARVRALRARGVALVYVSHRLEEVFAVSDRISVLRDGLLVASRPRAEWDEAGLVRAMVGRDLPPPAARSRVAGEVLLEVDGLGRGTAFDDVSFALRRGEVLGLAGLVGSGCSALLRALSGLAPAQRGRLRVRGASARIARPREALALGIALVPADRLGDGLVPERSVRENASLAALRELSRGPCVDRERERDAVDAIGRRVGLERISLETAVQRLSGGNQQKVVLARALLCRPGILLLDEPTRGVDVGAKAEIHALIEALADSGCAVLLASGDLPELLALSDRILVMRSGRVTAALARGEASEERVVAAAAGVAAA
jgi:ABC-type sugar transport system ATPase subunit